VIQFVVYGIPAPKGSMHAFIPKGWKRAIVTDSNPKVKPRAAAVTSAAVDQCSGRTTPRSPRSSRGRSTRVVRKIRSVCRSRGQRSACSLMRAAPGPWSERVPQRHRRLSWAAQLKQRCSERIGPACRGQES
jgi:hypothetical protein